MVAPFVVIVCNVAVVAGAPVLNSWPFTKRFVVETVVAPNHVDVAFWNMLFVLETVSAKRFVVVAVPTSSVNHRCVASPSLYVRSAFGMISEATRALIVKRSVPASPKVVFVRTTRFPVVVTFPCRDIVKTSLEEFAALIKKSKLLSVPSVVTDNAVREETAASAVVWCIEKSDPPAAATDDEA